ncbi:MULTISPECIES: hypothetical protein [unclassified Rathayibacter]|uniref:hypothetical protein n=1 Tax=unclassified Rathayibacter TaxID=2609250 RepID=UPI00188AE1E7|nr:MULTISPECIES: hypothetical protein [unclassified Rathayibacter]MBF4461337.1 hypothetical protein [Rathayibacter sp. VKM Ac-2879]MBF4502748.1 hypothetical protein [Rathayibacter sp. VKM Ac-2878]
MSRDHFVLSTATPWDDRTDIIGVYASAAWAREAAASWLHDPTREGFPRCVVETWNGAHLLGREVIEGIDVDDGEPRPGPREI